MPEPIEDILKASKKDFYNKLDEGSVIPTKSQQPSQASLEDYNVPITEKVSTKGFGESIFDNNSIYIPEEVDTPEKLNELRSEEQGGFNELGAGILRTVDKALIETAKLPGVLYGLGDWAGTGFDGKQIDKALTNNWITALEDTEAYINKEVLPVYIGESVKNGDLIDKLSSGEFWATTGADGAGFLLSMMVPGLAIGRLGTGAKIAAKGGKFATKLGKVTDIGIESAANTYVEAISEGREIYNEILQSTGDKTKAAEAAGGTFKANLALLAVSNVLDQTFFLKDFYKAARKGKFPTEGSTKGMFDNTGKILDEFSPTTVGKFTKNASGKLVGSFAKEGFFEEGTQFSIGEYYKNVENSKKNKGFLEQVSGIATAYMENLDNVDMQASIALGGILGAGVSIGSQGYGDVKQNISGKKLHGVLKNNLVNNYNSYSDLIKKNEDGSLDLKDGEVQIDPVKAKEYAVSKEHELFQDIAMNEAIKNKDEELYGFIKNVRLFNNVLPILKETGNTQVIEGYIKNLAMSMNDYAKANNLPTEDISKLETSIKQKVQTFNNIYNRVKQQNDITYKVDLENVDNSLKHKTQVLNNKLSEAITQEYIRERITDLSNTLTSKGINLNEDINPQIVELTTRKDDTGIDEYEAKQLKNSYKQIENYTKDFDESVTRSKQWNNAKYVKESGDTYIEDAQATTKESENIAKATLLNDIPDGTQFIDKDDNIFTISKNDKYGTKLVSEDKKKSIEINSIDDLDNYTEYTPTESDIQEPIVQSNTQDIPTEVFTSSEGFNLPTEVAIKPEVEDKIVENKNIIENTPITNNDEVEVKNPKDTSKITIAPSPSLLTKKTVTKDVYSKDNSEDTETLSRLESIYKDNGIKVIGDMPNEFSSARRFAKFLSNNNVSKGFSMEIRTSIPNADNSEEVKLAEVENKKLFKDNPDLGRTLYTLVGKLDESGTFKAVDESGNIIEDSDIGTKGVYSFLPIPTIEYNDSSLGYKFHIPKGANKEVVIKQVNEDNKEYKARKLDWLDRLDKGERLALNITGKSKGIEINEENSVTINNEEILTGDYKSKPVKELSDIFGDNYSIIVATKDVTDINGTQINRAKGQVILTNNDTSNIHFVNTRKLDTSESEVIISLFKSHVNNNFEFKGKNVVGKKGSVIPGENTSLHNELRKLVYFTGNNKKLDSDVDGTTLTDDIDANGVNKNTNSQFFIRDIASNKIKDTIVVFKGEEYKLFDPIKLENKELSLNPELITGFTEGLPTMNHQVSDKLLNNTQDVFKLPVLTTEGKLSTKPFRNGYSEYLFENVLQTNLKPPTTVKIWDKTNGIVDEQTNIVKSQYAIYNPEVKVIKDVYVEETSIFDDTIESPEGETSTVNEDGFGFDIEGFTEDVRPDDNNKEDVISFDKLPSTSKNTIDFNKAEEFLNNTFGNKDYKVVKGLINNRAWGQFKDGAIILSDIAGSGTEYHEAFHKVSQLYYTQAERAELYNNWRSLNTGKKLDSYKSNDKLAEEFSDIEVEEYLAEDFRKFMEGKEVKSYQKTLFSKLKALITKIANLFTTKVEQLAGDLNYRVKPVTDINKAFNEISKGYYKYRKQINDNPTNTFNRIPDKDDRFTQLALRSINYEFFKRLYKDGFNVKTINKQKPGVIYNSIKEDYSKKIALWYDQYKTTTNPSEKEQLRHIITNVKDIVDSLNDPNNPNGIVTLHQKELGKLGLTIKDIDNLALEEGKGKDSGSNFWATKSLQISAKDTAAFEVKSLLSAILDAKPTYQGNNAYSAEPIYNELGLPMAIDYNTMSSTLFNKLAGSTSVNDMVTKMMSMKDDLPGVMLVMKYFKLRDVPNGRNEWALRNKFWDTFHNQKHDYTVYLLDPEQGKTIAIDATENAHSTRINNSWYNNAIDNNNFVPNEEGSYVYSKKLVERLNKPNSFNEAIDVLKILGISFNNVKKDGSNLPEGTTTEQIKRLAEGIYDDILAKRTKNLFIKELNDSSQRLQQLIDLELATALNNVENSHVNPSGDKQYNIALHSYISRLFDDINYYTTREELLEANPHLKDKYAANSQILGLNGLIFNSKGKKRSNTNAHKISANIIESIREFKGEDSLFENAPTNDKAMYFMESMLKFNEYPMLRPSDNKIFRTFKFPSLYVNKEESISQMNSYLKDELVKFIETRDSSDSYEFESNLSSGILIDIIQNSGSNKAKTALNSILNDEVSSIDDINIFISEFGIPEYNSNGKNESLDRIFDDYIETQIKTNSNFLFKNKAITVNKDIKGEVENIRYLNNNYTPDVFNSMMEELVIKQLFGSIEQTKLLFGSPVYYKSPDNFFKRMTGPIGTKQFPNTEASLTTWMKLNMPRIIGKDIEQNQDNPIIKTTTFSDLEIASSYLEEYKTLFDTKEGKDSIEKYYGNLNVGDGQGYITLDEYRDLLFRMGQWDDAQEDLYQWEAKYHKADKNTRRSLLNDKPSGVFNPLKPQYFGPLAEEYFVPSFFKLSLAPLIPSVIVGRPMEDLHNELISNKIGIGVFKSANKVGVKVENNNSQTVFNSDYSIKTLTDPLIQNTYMKYWGIQLHIAQKVKDHAPSGTQFAKQIISNLRDNSGNFINDEAKDLYNNILTLNKTRLNLNKETLISKLGLVKTDGGNASETAIDSLKQMLKDELITRGSSDARIESLEFINQNGIDILPNRSAIESILFSIADKKVIRKARLGTMAIQVSAAMMNIGKKAYESVTVGDTTYSESNLNFYTNDNGTIKSAEIYLSSFYKSKIAKGQITDTRLLKILGFRIPTQGLNSIESLIIKDFLPEEAGNIIILPREIVAKSGSDFDIDKLNIYYPNSYIDNKGEPVYVDNSSSYQDYTKTKDENSELLTEQEFKLLQVENELQTNYHDLLTSEFNFKNLITPIGSETLEAKAAMINKLKGKDKTVKSWTNITEFQTAVDKANENLGAQRGIGIAATQATSHILFQHGNIKLNKNIRIKVGSKLKNINTTIKFPHNTKDGLIYLGGVTTQAGENIGELLNETVTAFVDAGTNPFIYDLINNINNSNIFMYLFRAGVPLDTVALFLNQPVIVDYLNELSLTRGLSFSGENLSKTKLKEAVIDKYTKNIDNRKFESDISNKNLASMISNKNLTVNQKLQQEQLLEDFIRYEASADAVRGLVQSLSYDTAPPKNTSELLTRKFTVEEIQRNNWFEQTGLDNLYNNGFITPYKEVTESLEDTFKYYIDGLKNPKIRNLINLFVNMYNHPTVSMSKDDKTKATELLRTELYTYILHNTDNITSRFDELFKGSNSMAVRVSKAKKEGKFAENYLLKMLTPIPRGNNISNVKLENTSGDSLTEDLIVQGWEDIYKQDSILGNDLLDFVILQSGMLQSPMNFIRFAPNKYLSEKLNKASGMLNTFNEGDFLMKFYENNFNSNIIIPTKYNEALPFYKTWTKQKDPNGKFVMVDGKPVWDMEIKTTGDKWLIGKDLNWTFGTVTGTQFLTRAVKDIQNNLSAIDYGSVPQVNTIEVSNKMNISYSLDISIPITTTEKIDNTKSNFLGYKGGFENIGKGTPNGDGKDKAMRKVSDGAIGEMIGGNKKSSTATTMQTFMDELWGYYPKKQDTVTAIGDGGMKKVMLARNGELNNKPLLEQTKLYIKRALDNGAEFVVGDMPGVDSQFVDYLQELGAKFTIYHTGTTPRINVKNNTTTQITNEDINKLPDCNI